MKRKVIAGIIVLVVIITIAVNAGKKSTPPSASAATTTTGVAAISKTPGIGQTVKDGSFVFVVKGITCGASAAAAVGGAGGFGETVPAGAQECLVTLSVMNDKGSSQTYFASNQIAFDARGRKFAADGTGATYLANSNDFTDINPGISITAIVPFQIPATAKIVSVELHDSAYSGGVTVKL